MQQKKTIKIKHNKKRNTAFLYESLILEITKSILEKDDKKKNSIIQLCREFFSAGKILKQELDLYRALSETNNLDRNIAEKVLIESKNRYSSLEKTHIFNEQTKLISKINKLYNGIPFSNFVPQYKNLATIAQIFADTTPVKEKVLLENSIIEKMSAQQHNLKEEQMQPLDNLAYKVFVKKFNEQYDEHLLGEQKELITKYVMSFADSGLEFKLFLNEELGRIKQELWKATNKKDISSDSVMIEKTNKIIKIVEAYSNKNIDQTMIKEVLKIQSLLSEINSGENKNG